MQQVAGLQQSGLAQGADLRAAKGELPHPTHCGDFQSVDNQWSHLACQAASQLRCGASDTGNGAVFAETRGLIEGHWLFDQMPADLVDGIARHARIETYTPGETIFHKDDPGLGLMAVVEGRVRISSTSIEDREVTLNIIERGEIFGEIALLDGGPRTADATAMEPTRLLVLDRRDFLQLLRRRPEAATKIIHVLCDRIRRTTEQLEDSTFLLQSARLAKTLLRLAERYGENGTHVDLKLSQRELGTLVGMRREAMNRQLGKWRELGIIAIEDGRISVLDAEALESEFDRLI